MMGCSLEKLKLHFEAYSIVASTVIVQLFLKIIEKMQVVHL